MGNIVRTRFENNGNCGYHGAVKVGFIAFVRIREERELRNAQDVPVDVLYTLFPH